MKRLIIAAAVTMSLIGCASNKLAADKDKELITATAAFMESNGTVEVTFDDQGNWIKMTSTATAAIPIADELGLEQGFNAANLRAKRNIVEFMNNQLRSNTSVDNMTKSLAKSIGESGSDTDEVSSKQRAANVAMEVREKITSESAGILRGVYVTERKVSGKMVMVKVSVDKRSMKAARSLSASFAQ